MSQSIVVQYYCIIFLPAPLASPRPGRSTLAAWGSSILSNESRCGCCGTGAIYPLGGDCYCCCCAWAKKESGEYRPEPAAAADNHGVVCCLSLAASASPSFLFLSFIQFRRRNRFPPPPAVRAFLPVSPLGIKTGEKAH